VVTRNPSWSISGTSFPCGIFNRLLINEPIKSPLNDATVVMNVSLKSSFNSSPISNPAFKPNSMPSIVFPVPSIFLLIGCGFKRLARVQDALVK